MKTSRKKILLLTFGVTLLLCVLFRADVKISALVVSQSDKIGVQSPITQFAAQYLIKTKHTASYSYLQSVFFTCHAPAHSHSTDWSARLAAEILGKYQTQDAFNLLISIVSTKGQDIPCGFAEIPYGLSLFGEEYYSQLLEIAKDNKHGYARVNAITAIGLMKPSHSHAVLDLSNVLYSTSDIFVQGRVLHAFFCINTQESLIAKEEFVRNENFRYSIDVYPCSVENIINTNNSFANYGAAEG